MWVSSELAGYTSFPGLSNVIKVSKRVKRLKHGEWVESDQYAVTSLTDIDPKGALSLVKGHWGIENRLFHVKDDSFGEDRHVMQHHGSGAVLSLFRNVALTLLSPNPPKRRRHAGKTGNDGRGDATVQVWSQ